MVHYHLTGIFLRWSLRHSVHAPTTILKQQRSSIRWRVVPHQPLSRNAFAHILTSTGFLSRCKSIRPSGGTVPANWPSTQTSTERAFSSRLLNRGRSNNNFMPCPTIVTWYGFAGSPKVPATGDCGLAGKSAIVGILFWHLGQYLTPSGASVLQCVQIMAMSPYSQCGYSKSKVLPPKNASTLRRKSSSCQYRLLVSRWRKTPSRQIRSIPYA